MIFLSLVPDFLFLHRYIFSPSHSPPPKKREEYKSILFNDEILYSNTETTARFFFLFFFWVGEGGGVLSQLHNQTNEPHVTRPVNPPLSLSQKKNGPVFSWYWGTNPIDRAAKYGYRVRIDAYKLSSHPEHAYAYAYAYTGGGIAPREREREKSTVYYSNYRQNQTKNQIACIGLCRFTKNHTSRLFFGGGWGGVGGCITK